MPQTPGGSRLTPVSPNRHFQFLTPTPDVRIKAKLLTIENRCQASGSERLHHKRRRDQSPIVVGPVPPPILIQETGLLDSDIAHLWGPTAHWPSFATQSPQSGHEAGWRVRQMGESPLAVSSRPPAVTAPKQTSARSSKPRSAEPIARTFYTAVPTAAARCSDCVGGSGLRAPQRTSWRMVWRGWETWLIAIVIQWKVFGGLGVVTH
jgi:hypothetical protein